MNKTINTKVGQTGNSLKLKARSIKRQLISRFQLLIIYINFMINKNNNKGRGEEKYGRRTSIDYKKMIRKVAVAGFVLAAMMGVGLFAGANRAEAAFSCDSGMVN